MNSGGNHILMVVIGHTACSPWPIPDQWDNVFVQSYHLSVCVCVSLSCISSSPHTAHTCYVNTQTEIHPECTYTWSQFNTYMVSRNQTAPLTQTCCVHAERVVPCLSDRGQYTPRWLTCHLRSIGLAPRVSWVWSSITNIWMHSREGEGEGGASGTMRVTFRVQRLLLD